MYESLADAAISGRPLSREDALAVLATPDEDLLDLAAAGFRVRRHFFGRRVKLNYLVNIKSGMCPEDCSYCSQRLGSQAGILKYSWLAPGEAAQLAEAGVKAGVKRVCLVASGRGPSHRDIERVAAETKEIKDRYPGVEVCACLGILADGQAEVLGDAGVDAYNHNLNTSERAYSSICGTHEFADRVNTVKRVAGAGISACSGLIAGMGETDEDLVDAVFALRDLGVKSVPVNFLMPFEGTPLAGRWDLNPRRCLRILALARFACPDAEVRIGGGREMHLRSLQPLALHLANSIFLGDYLTSEGQPGGDDLAMIADAGLVIEGAGDAAALPEPTAPTLRRRGAGTTTAPNA